MTIEYKDYYAILGVNKKAGPEEIKQAYRGLAKKFHPDLHPESRKAAMSEKFKEINEAYEVLSDSQKRQKYDALGSDWQAQREAPGPQPGAGQESYRRYQAGGGQADFSDFFNSIFGGQGGFRGFSQGGGFQGFGQGEEGGAYGFNNAPEQYEGGKDVEYELPLTIEDAFSGGQKQLSVPMGAPCSYCGGTGRAGRKICASCGGAGEIRQTSTIKVNLPRAVRNGTLVRLRGQGPGGRGDIYLRIRLLDSPRFRVSGDDIETAVTVMPWDAALGGEISVPGIKGPVTMKLPGGTHSGKRFRVSGRGLPKADGTYGDLYAIVRIDIPDDLGPAMQDLFRKLKTLR